MTHIVKIQVHQNIDFSKRDNMPKSREISVNSLKCASKACRQFIESNGLGSGNFSDAEVCDATGRRVAFVSFNGRLWTPESDWRNRQPIEVR